VTGGNVTYTQQVRSCGDHDGCTVIACTEDGTGSQVWESHAGAATHPECRANPDHPLLAADGTALDGTREQCEGCRDHFNGGQS
jgi:hypothetical protein